MFEHTRIDNSVPDGGSNFLAFPIGIAAASVVSAYALIFRFEKIRGK